MPLVSREALLAEIASLRGRVDELQEEVRQLREATVPTVPYPDAWDLTPNESRLLTILANARGGVLDRERILVSLYGSEIEAETRIVDVLVSKLRRKLSPFDVAFRSVWGVGYGLTSESLPIVSATQAAA